MDQSQLTDAMLRVYGRNYRNVNNRWWVLLDNRWWQQGARDGLHMATWRMCRDLWPKDPGFPDYLIQRQMRTLATYLMATDLPGRPEHTERVAKHLGISEDDR